MLEKRVVKLILRDDFNVADACALASITSFAERSEFDFTSLPREGDSYLSIRNADKQHAQKNIVVLGSIEEAKQYNRQLYVCCVAEDTNNNRGKIESNGVQLVGHFLPSHGWRSAKKGSLDMRNMWHERYSSDLIQNLLEELAMAAEVITWPAAPIVTMALGYGAKVLIEEGPDGGWPWTAKSITGLPLTKSGKHVYIQDVFSRRSTIQDINAAPKILRKIKQSIFLSFVRSSAGESFSS